MLLSEHAITALALFGSVLHICETTDAGTLRENLWLLYQLSVY